MSAFKLPSIKPGHLQRPTQEQAALTRCADIGPFDSPADYVFEPELLPPVPRPTPPRTWQKRQERQWTWNAIAFVFMGVAFFFCAERGMAPRLGKLVVPLAYLPWIAGGLIALGVLQFVLGRLRLGPARYIWYGIPLVARVAGQDEVPTLLVDGQPLYYTITALVEYREPQSGEVRSRVVKSPEFAAEKKNDYATTFQIGDYVTAVYLPGNYPESLQLFEFLDLGPELGFLRRGRS